MLCFRSTGIFFIIAGLLLLTRLIPVMANLPPGFEGFPPSSLEQMALLASHNPSGWRISHTLGLTALPFLWLGFFGLFQRYMEKGLTNRALAGMFGITSGVVLFAAALLIDGKVVPYVAQIFMAGESVPRETSSLLLDSFHKLAISFFIPAMLSLLIGSGFMASPMIHRALLNRWLGFSGIILANVGFFGHVFGWTGENFNHMPLAGIIMMGLFFWFLITGVFCLITARQIKLAKA